MNMNKATICFIKYKETKYQDAVTSFAQQMASGVFRNLRFSILHTTAFGNSGLQPDSVMAYSWMGRLRDEILIRATGEL
jgi:hypothetical protein